MLRQFPEISSWRKHDITIEPNEVHTLNFRDTTPNIFVLNNPNLATLKIGISAIPRDDSYEFKVEYNTTETIGRPIGTNNLYILNDSSIPVKIVVFSIEKEFDPSILKNMNVSLEGYTLESNSEISGIKEGVKLPVHMDDNQHSELVNVMKSIEISGVKTNVSLPMKLNSTQYTEIKNLITSLNDYMAEMQQEKSSRDTNPTYLNNVDGFNLVAGGNESVHFDWLFNDGSEVTIHRTRNGVKTALFTVKTDEAFADFDIELETNDTLSIESANGETVVMRIKYWTYVR